MKENRVQDCTREAAEAEKEVGMAGKDKGGLIDGGEGWGHELLGGGSREAGAMRELGGQEVGFAKDWGRTWTGSQ